MPKKPVLRSCTSCREKKEKKDLLRIVRLPSGDVEIDTTGKKPGRGAYICATEKCINQAKKTKRLDASLKCEVPEAVYTEAMRYCTNEQ
ncbi:MAG: YlxR family protein [Peptococcaceae bacterium]|nr:YlxR family protein [Peptococcaceae bacterium]